MSLSVDFSSNLPSWLGGGKVEMSTNENKPPTFPTAPVTIPTGTSLMASVGPYVPLVIVGAILYLVFRR